ncbi:hypothetical protein EX30DRAFT_305165 [Ascodesmis nigricans]|uniref:Glycerophosphocholine acyltransferase 1 n=1 Tax=Ascodesmis nigricans TaxID=341454 RepID=A0A4S2MZY2_9PEZI|nr:hypothetical protein EX30DRAFT_305165 [Ascodesmis nigricans]
MPSESQAENLIPDVEVEPGSSSSSESDPNSPPLTRTHSRTSVSSMSSHPSDDWEIFPPLDKLSIFDFLDQLALPQRIEKINRTVLTQRDKLRDRQNRITKSYRQQKDKVLKKAEVEKYLRKYNEGIDRLMVKWDDTRVVSTREKISFVVGVSNIFITGFLMGAHPEWVHIWYSLQLIYFMPIRYFTYHQKGYHYFLADLCYFVNVLLMLAIWVFPTSRRLMISAYCLSYGNNAWAIAMWRNSMVFHSLDKVTSLFIHIMPPVVLHCLVHLADPAWVAVRFPAVDHIKYHDKYSLGEMIVWATVPYAIWQISYHLLITVRRRDKIAAGRPTSFTWLRKSYANTWIGKAVLSLPNVLQEPAFMFIQYVYAVVTMLPCTLWFYNPYLSGAFVSLVGLWSIYNGATFYIDVFGKRFQRELEQLKKESIKWQQSSPTPLPSPAAEVPVDLNASDTVDGKPVPHMDITPHGSSSLEFPDTGAAKERNNTTGSLPLQQ